MKKTKIGIIGCGAIGSGIAGFIDKKLSDKAAIVALSDIDAAKAKNLSKKIKSNHSITNIKNLINKSDLIIESAGMHISARIAEMCVSAGRDVLVMSTGGLLKKRSLFKKARVKKCNVYIPSGAICGIDGLSAASIGKIKKVALTTRKPIKGLRGALGLKNPKSIKKETVIFNGTAEKATRYFPKNINVAATLSLNGVGAKKTKVKIVTSPKYKKNIHEVEIEGEFGKIFTRTENVPSKENPKTSQLAIFSALAKLKEVI